MSRGWKHWSISAEDVMDDASPSDCQSQGLQTWTRAGRSRVYIRWTQRAAKKRGSTPRPLHYLMKYNELIIAMATNHGWHFWH